MPTAAVAAAAIAAAAMAAAAGMAAATMAATAIPTGTRKPAHLAATAIPRGATKPAQLAKAEQERRREVQGDGAEKSGAAQGNCGAAAEVACR